MGWLWFGFVALILLVLTLDLAVVNRRPEAISVRRAMGFTAFTIVLALAFAFLVYWLYDTDYHGIASSRPDKDAITGLQATAQYLNAWVIEYALSLDNILVIALIFRYFTIPPKYQHRVLFWGILGALVMRGAMIGAGTMLVQSFEWVLYIFGAILLYTAVKILITDEQAIDPEKTIAARLARRIFPLCPELDGQKFFTRRRGVTEATPLFLVLLVIEGTDVIFAIDSIPAAFAITSEPFLVFTSNIFAILGLRSMYFALAAVIDRFRFLKVALVLVLGFIGVKMLISRWLHIAPEISLAVVVSTLAVGIGASFLVPAKSRRRHEPTGGSHGAIDGPAGVSSAAESPGPPKADSTALEMRAPENSPS